MSGGLLDLINDPVFMAGLEERRRIAATLADRWGCSLASAREWLEQEDARAMELFAIGDTVPRNILN